MSNVARVSLFLLISAFAASPGTTQPAIPAQFGESLEVQIYNLDTVVTDAQGRPVRGLTKDDFVVLENGAPQPISHFSFYDMGASSMSISDAGEVINTPAQTTVAEEPPRRRFIFFIDEMAIQGQARNTLKKQAETFLSAMRPGDMATVVRPASTAQVEQTYSSDPQEVAKWLNKAIDSCRIRLTAPAFAELRRFRQAMETATLPAEIATAKQIYIDQQQTRVQQRIGELRALIASLAAAEEKKILVLITSGLNAQPGREVYSTDEQLMLTEMTKMKDHATIITEMGNPLTDPTNPQDTSAFRGLANAKVALRTANRTQGWNSTFRPQINDLKSQIDDLGRTAAANRIVIYALTPEIPLFLDTGRGADARTAPGVSTLMGDGVHLQASRVVPEEMLSQLLTYEGETLQSFAEKTGGRWFRGTAVIDDTFRTLFDDLQVYYSLAYRAKSGSKEARRVAVQVKGRPELKVRTRSEVIDRGGDDMASRVIAGLLYPIEADQLKMAVKTDRPQKEGKKFNVPLEVVIPIEKITFLRLGDGSYQGRVIVHYAAAAEKEFVSYGRQEQIIALTAAQYREMVRIRYRYTSNITVPKGKIRIALGVVDTTSKMSSLQTVNVTAQ